MFAAVSLFLALYNDLKPIIQELGGPKGIIADGLAVHRAIKEAHDAVTAARAAASPGAGKITPEEGEVIAIAFIGEVASAIAKGAGITDSAQALALTQRLGERLLPKVFKHITGEDWAGLQAIVKDLPPTNIEPAS